VKDWKDVTVARSMNRQQEIENRMLILSECGTKREYMFFFINEYEKKIHGIWIVWIMIITLVF